MGNASTIKDAIKETKSNFASGGEQERGKT